MILGLLFYVAICSLDASYLKIINSKDKNPYSFHEIEYNVSIQDYNDKSSHYQSLIGHIHKVQNELKSLEKEWLEIEEGYLINEQ